MTSPTPIDVAALRERLRKGLEGVTNLYDITREGAVISRTGWRGHGKRELAQAPNSDGYPSVRVLIDGQRRHIPVHCLVAHVYLPPQPSPDHEIRHLDGDKNNPRDSNLCWGTRSENAEDRCKHGAQNTAKLTGDTVRRMRLDARSDAEIAAELKVNITTVRKARSGRHWKWI